MPLTPERRLYAQKTWGRAADAFETVAWRAPGAARFDTRVASDLLEPEPTLKALAADLPAWVTVVGGGLIAALMGAVLGGALQV